jgi:phosphoglycolate phosphatase/pyrophosphatase PpaX
VVITGDDVKIPKPDPEGILLAMAHLGASAANTVFVGDSNADVKAAKAANVLSVGVNWLSVSQTTGGFDPQPDRVYTDPAAFARWILAKGKTE